jgi:deoxycytidylate deaminase
MVTPSSRAFERTKARVSNTKQLIDNAAAFVSQDNAVDIAAGKVSKFSTELWGNLKSGDFDTYTKVGAGGLEVLSGAWLSKVSRVPAESRSGNGVTIESRSSREPMGRTVSDQDMIDMLIEKRASSGAPGNATFAMGRAGDGAITPVRESIPGKTREHDIHAEPQVLKDLEGTPKPHTVAVDQQPCADCAQKLLDSDTRAIIPQDVNRPKRRPKSSAVKAAEGKTQVVPREVDLENEKH